MFGDLERFCLFLGYPRSGHTLVGTLLNAHPEMVISHELDALGVVEEGIRCPEELFSRILARDKHFARRGRVHVYEYTVSGTGSWQGRWRRLRVIGDKKGSKSARRLHDRPDLLDALTALVRLPIQAIHVIRSPWDNIATMARRDGKASNSVDLSLAGKRYWLRCDSVHRIREQRPDLPLLDVYYEDLVRDPKRGLKELCAFLGVDWDAAWAEACAKIVYAAPHRSRFSVSWPEEVRDSVRARMDRYPWLRPDHRVFGEPTPEEEIRVVSAG